MPMAERTKSSPLMDGLLGYLVRDEASLGDFEEFLNYENRRDISAIRDSVAAYKKFFFEAINTLTYNRGLSPYTAEGKGFVKDVYEATAGLKKFLSDMSVYGERHSKTWTDEMKTQIRKLVADPVEIRGVKYAPLPQLVDEQLGFVRELYAKPVLYESRSKLKPKPEPAASEPDMAAAGNVVAIVAMIALGFVMLNGLNNLQAASPAGALPSLNTGFFLLPGGPFVSSLQMVLFMLSAAVAVMYLAGKALGEW